MSNSYKKYKEYRENRHRYKVEQVAFPIAMMLIIGFVTKFKWLILLIILVVIGKVIWDCINNTLKQNSYSQEAKISMSKNGNSTETGYINKNNQRNNGRTDKPGTGHGQWFYDMDCLNCGQKYYANGHDVWLRKCPKCQGGRP